MREIQQRQLALLPAPLFGYDKADELEQMSRILDDNPDIAEAVHQDVVGESDPTVGRPGLSANQVLRLGLLKQRFGYSYDELPFAIADSVCVRRFVRIGLADDVPADTTIWENVAKVTPETWQWIKVPTDHSDKWR